jgi:hypothetical protein
MINSPEEEVHVFLDGVLAFTVSSTNAMRIATPDNQMKFFLDDVTGFLLPQRSNQRSEVLGELLWIPSRSPGCGVLITCAGSFEFMRKFR